MTINFSKVDFELLPTDDLSGVSDDGKECLRLVTDEKLSYKATADKLGISIGTVKSRINRARLRIVNKRGAVIQRI